jgi:predicted phage terminase large subunit-like protein
LQIRDEVRRLEGSLIEFYKAAWEVMDPAPYQHNWHLDAIAEHLEAISYGWIRKLCINLPPRHSKTLLVSVCWNAWLWARQPDEKYPLLGPGGRLMCLSYADTLAMDNAVLARRLVESPWYQERWGNRVTITDDQDAKNKFDTTAGGTRISGSFKGSVTGRGAGIRIYDDPHKMTEVESQPIREGVLRLYDTTLKSRITDPRTSAEVLVAQRGHQDDLSSKFLDSGDVVHLNLPAEYDSARHCVTVLKFDEQGEPEKTWEDPREVDGERLWATRFGTKELAQYKKNPFEWQAQWQQAPIPRGGGLFKEHWIQGYEVPTGGAYNFVPRFVLASLDTAFKENEENDYNALSVWYVYDDPKTKARKLLLADAWKKRLPLHGDRVDRNPEESEKSYVKRASPKWGLVEWVNFTCMKRRVNRLIIEDSARGHDLTAELRRVFGGRNYGVRLVKPRGGDKWARAHAVVDLFTDEMIYAPGEWVGNEWRWRDWVYEVLNELCGFPRMSHDDMVDSIVQALRHLRECGLAIRREERELADEIASRYKEPARPLYEV